MIDTIDQGLGRHFEKIKIGFNDYFVRTTHDDHLILSNPLINTLAEVNQSEN